MNAINIKEEINLTIHFSNQLYEKHSELIIITKRNELNT